MTLDAFRKKVATPTTSVQLCLLGIIGGVCAASLIILFRLGIEQIQLLYLPQVNEFNTIGEVERLLLPIVGTLLILLVAYLTGFKHYRMGIPFVIHRVKQHYGHIPFRTTINQFFGGMLALASGFSVGREGPSVHLGAAGSSFLGQWLKLPNNSIRILAGCGVAAGISASFNTPFAAVIFVMEVVMREYKIHIFIPVMLAAASGSVLTRIVFGETQELAFMHFHGFSMWIYLYLILFGVLLGFIANFFNNSLMLVIRSFERFSMIKRLLIAGSVTGIIGFILPEAMGAHFHSANELFMQQDKLMLLIAVLAAKFLLTILAIGLGVPGGVIGPVFVIGMLSGALLVMPLGYFMQASDELTSSFALLGMAGLLTAVLHAPMAALSAVMELSFSPELILPAMLVVVPAYVTSTQLLGNSSIFTRQLEYQKLPYTISSVRETLQETGVVAVMNEDYKLFIDMPDKVILAFLAGAPTHTVVQCSYFELDQQYSLVQYDTSLARDNSALAFFNMQGLSSQATLAEVYDILQAGRRGAVYIYDSAPSEIIGVISWNTLRNHLHKEQY
jgi:CIC family chloride channel protein